MGEYKLKNPAESRNKKKFNIFHMTHTGETSRLDIDDNAFINENLGQVENKIPKLMSLDVDNLDGHSIIVHNEDMYRDYDYITPRVKEQEVEDPSFEEIFKTEESYDSQCDKLRNDQKMDLFKKLNKQYNFFRTPQLSNRNVKSKLNTDKKNENVKKKIITKEELLPNINSFQSNASKKYNNTLGNTRILRNTNVAFGTKPNSINPRERVKPVNIFQKPEKKSNNKDDNVALKILNNLKIGEFKRKATLKNICIF